MITEKEKDGTVVPLRNASHEHDAWKNASSAVAHIDSRHVSERTWQMLSCDCLLERVYDSDHDFEVIVETAIRGHFLGDPEDLAALREEAFNYGVSWIILDSTGKRLPHLPVYEH